MKTTLIALIIVTCLSFQEFNNVPAIIHLKNGEAVQVYHFGQLNCSVNKYFSSYIILKGKYAGTFTEIKDYSNISRIVLSNFTAEPVSSLGNQKGKVTIYKKNGVSVELEEAEFSLSCYGSVEKYNELRVQVINPLTEKPIERTIPVKDIEYILFQ